MSNARLYFQAFIYAIPKILSSFTVVILIVYLSYNLNTSVLCKTVILIPLLI